MIPMWLLFGVESFLKPSKVTSLKSPHTWLFLKEARLDAWPRVGLMFTSFLYTSSARFGFGLQKRKVMDNLKARPGAGHGVKSPKRQLELLRSLHGSRFCLNSKLLQGLGASVTGTSENLLRE